MLSGSEERRPNKHDQTYEIKHLFLLPLLAMCITVSNTTLAQSGSVKIVSADDAV